MKKLPILILLVFSLTCSAQNWKKSETKWVNPFNLDPIPMRQQTFWEKNKKSFAITGIQLASLALEASGDALFDVGKREGDLSKMRLGHTLQATGYGVLVLMIPMIDWDHPVADGVKVALSWGLLRYATFDLMYNAVAGLPPLYAGTTSTHDNFVSKMPPDGRAITKGFALGFHIAINFKEF